MRILYFIIMCLLFIGCETMQNVLPEIDGIEYCYEADNGQRHCGGISFAKKETEKQGSLVIENTDKETGEKEELFTFTGDEVRVIASQLGNMNLPEGVKAKSFGVGEKPSYMKASLTDIQKCKEYCKQKLQE